MAHRIVWSRRAAQDLDSITDYIAADSPAYAGTVLKKIVKSDEDSGVLSAGRPQSA
jgi:plasmid stabilization system protein ParE